MRILLIPMLTSSRRHINSDSDFRSCRTLVQSFYKAGLPAFFYFLVPKKSEGYVELWEGDNYKLLYIDEYSGHTIYEQANGPLDIFTLFDTVDGKYPIDCILSERTFWNGAIRRGFLDWCGREIPVFTLESKTLALAKSENHNAVFEADLRARVFGYMMSYNMFATKSEFDYGIECMRRYCSPFIIKEFIKNSEIVPFEIDTDEIDEATEGVKKSEKFTLFWTGRMNTNKNWDKAADLFDKFFCIGNDVRILISSPLNSARYLDKKISHTEIKYTGGNLSRKEYLKALCSSHIGVSFSDIEGFTVGIIEQVYAGMIVLLPGKKRWARSLFGDAGKNYPFYYNDFVEAYTLMKDIYEDFDAAYEKMEPVRRFVRENYRDVVVSAKRFDMMNRKIAEFNDRPYARIKKGWEEVIRGAIGELPAEFCFEDVISEMKKKADFPVMICKKVKKPVYVGANEIYRFICEEGHVDLCNNENPKFRRRG